MAKCLSCGYLLESGEGTCPVCGASAAQTLNEKVDEAQPAPPPKARPPQSRMIVAVAFAVVAIGLAIFMSVRALAPKRPSYLDATRRGASQGARVATPPATPQQPVPEGTLPGAAQMPAGVYPTPPPPPTPTPQAEYQTPVDETSPQPEVAQPEVTEQADPNTTTVPGWVAYPKGGNAPTVVTTPGPEAAAPGGANAPPPAAIAPTPAAPTPPANQGGEAPPEAGGE